MNAPLPSRRRRGICPPASPQTYREAELGAAVVADALFFLRHPDRHHRIRAALPAEVRVTQVIESRLLEPSPGYTPVALVRRVDDYYRRRVVVEAWGVDFDAMGEAEIAGLFEQVTRHGWTAIEGRAA